jgi:hypothetical protein
VLIEANYAEICANYSLNPFDPELDTKLAGLAKMNFFRRVPLPQTMQLLADANELPKSAGFKYFYIGSQCTEMLL